LHTGGHLQPVRKRAHGRSRSPLLQRGGQCV